MSEYFTYDFVAKKYVSRLNGLDHAIALAAKAERERFTRVIVEVDERRKPLVVFDNRAQSRGGRIINCLRFEVPKDRELPNECLYRHAVEGKRLPEHEQIAAELIIKYGFDSICRLNCEDAVEEELFRD